MDQKQNLWDAHVLAEFSNMGPSELDRFCKKHPLFVPMSWWKLHNGQTWQRTQEFLREAWKEKFTGGFFTQMRLVLSVFDPGSTLEAALGMEIERFADLGDMTEEGTPFHRAVLFLFQNPWRARFCAECRNRFVAAEPKTKFCSQACSDEATRRRHNEWARKNLKAWRRKQKATKDRGRK